MVKLAEVATISSGVTFRSQIEALETGEVSLIQMKDLGQDNFVHLKESIRINYPKLKPNQLARSGDIIFRSRGQTNTAALLQEDTQNTIVAAPLFRIRANTKKALPAFLLWWINQSLSQAYLNSQSEGTMVKMVSKQSLEDLEVSLPSLEQQKKIAEFFDLSMKEQYLLGAIKNRRAIYVEGFLKQMTSEESYPTASDKNSGTDLLIPTPGQI